MTTTQNPNTSAPAIEGLRQGSYTAHRLQHATPEHLHLTTRRCFIGPIPEGWLKSHRKSWYRDYISRSNSSSKAAVFSSSPGVSQHKRMTGLDGPSSTTNISQSFPQPRDLQEETEDDDDDDRDGSTNEHGQDDNPMVERTLTEGEERIPVREYKTATAESVSSKPKNKWLQTTRNDSGKGLKKLSSSDTGATSFFTAPSEPRTSPESWPRKRRQSFVTALEPPEPQPSFTSSSYQSKTTDSSTRGNTRHDYLDRDSPTTRDGVNSRTSLLPRPDSQKTSHQTKTHNSHLDMEGNAAADVPSANNPQNHISSGMVRFNVPAEVKESGSRNIAVLSQISRRRSWRQIRKGREHPGEIIKTEKMLVRIDTATQQLPEEYDENDSIKTESRTLEKWREYVIVCREGRQEDESDFIIQLYKSRVIPAKEGPGASKRCTHEIPLLRKSTNVNLYSSLDKTLVIWLPWKSGTKIFILRPRSSSSSVEWYTFIRNTLGWKRSSDLQVNVPDLSVILQITNPFSQVEAAAKAAAAESSDSDRAILKTSEAEKAVANLIIQRCMGILRQSNEWSEVLESWMRHERMGLAWKRYDRLEWVHGTNEQRMYGTLAMQKSHELELRPKKHYPTSTMPFGRPNFKEPAPLEGFLIRLTSQRGRVQRLGKMYYKRLYFFTHNQFLCYCRPAKALPPPPPPRTSLGRASKIPTATEIHDQTPLVYAVNPYPIQNGEIEWLRKGRASDIARADGEAFVEAERRTNTLLAAEGYINICQIVEVRKVHRGSTPADANVDRGPDVDFHVTVADSQRDDGKTDEFDDDKTFELVMNNGLVVRLQAFNKETKQEWMNRMRELVEYWKLRTADDMASLKSVRQANLAKLDIDEEMEAHLGQFAEKWEVSRAIASPLLFNICGISCCRAITMSGTLYRKPRKHTTFLQCGVILCHGQLLIFHGKLRERTGKEIPHIQHERQTVIDLQNCYVYSGLVTDGDLLYQNRTFDSNHPGHNALPRIYLEDGWTSTDEDTMTCFVIWQATRKSFFRSGESVGGGGRLRYVSRLGVPGRSMVFKARSRAERDHWVMSVGMEIERLQQAEEVRVVEA